MKFSGSVLLAIAASCATGMASDLLRSGVAAKKTLAAQQRMLQADIVENSDSGDYATVSSEQSSEDTDSCVCNDGTRPAAGVPPIDLTKSELTYPNIALEVASIGVSLIPGTGAEPHKIAMVSSALYEAFSVMTDGVEPLTSAGMEAKENTMGDVTDDELDEYLGYAGYGALRRVLNGAPSQIALLDAKMEALGFDRNVVMGHSSAGIVMAVLMKYMPGPLPDYSSINAPSNMYDADCDNVVDINHWQAQCIQANPGEDCKPQMIPFLPLYDARLISANGERNITSLLSGFPQPPVYSLDDNSGNEEFFAEHQETLDLSAMLDDTGKFTTEFFEPNAAVRMGALSVNEAEAQGMSLRDSILLLFTVSGAVRDAIVGSVTLKLDYDTIRPVTLIQCALRGETIKAWSKPYYGVQEFVNDDSEDSHLWRPYLQTPPFPGYVSGHSAAAAAAATVFNKFFPDGVMASTNCAVQKMGTSRTEPKILRGELGYIAGVTDVPNEGPETVGYAPASDVTLCWESFDSLSGQLSDSRVIGGIHIPADTTYGYSWGETMGEFFFEFAMSKMT